jgi:transglutaminase-like putative cysteine protease
MRGAVLDQYGQGGRPTWEARRAGSYEPPGASNGRWVTLTPGRPGTDEIEQRVTVLSGSGTDAPLFALYRPVAVKLDTMLQRQEIKYERATGRISRSGDNGRISYTVTSASPEPDPNIVVRHDAAQYPAPGVKTYAYEVLRRASIEPDPLKRPLEEDERAARVFEAHLRQNFEYATDQLKAPPTRDPTDWFLHVAQRGHCEYFASAIAALCRSVGINARVVAGYLATEYDPARGVYVVRESDAHAWAEVDTGPEGWKVVDATPASTGQVARREGVLDSLQKVYAGVADFWNIHIATFGPQDQERLLSRFGLNRVVERSAEWSRGVVRWFRLMRRNLRSPATVAAMVGGLILGAGLVWVGVRAWKRRAPRREKFGWAMNGPERRIYRDLLRLLAGRGYEKPAWSPPMVHLRSIAARDPTLAEQAGRVFEHVYAARFGQDPRRLAAAQTELAELRRLE